MLLLCDKITLIQLRGICKIKKISNYSKLRKLEVIKLINSNLAILKIQKYLRSKWIDGRLCPISMQTVVYPCFAFRPKGFTFIYYNLEPLTDYLLSSGNFSDPKTREPYSDHTLKAIDKCNECKVGKSVYKASRNKNRYKQKKDKDEDLEVLEHCIDEVVSSIREILELRSTHDHELILHNFQFPTYHRYLRSVLNKSKDYAKTILTKTIHTICGPEEKPTPDPNNVKDFILQFMWTLEGNYFD